MSGDQRIPREDRHAEHRHPGGPQADDRRNDVDCAEDGADAAESKPDDPQVGTHTGGVEFAGEWHVSGPAEICCTTGCYEPGGGDQAAEEIQPVAERIEPRETHVRRADLQRHEVVGESEEDRGRVQQEHDRAVHGEQLVVLLV